MTLIDAIKSGLPFRLKTWDGSYWTKMEHNGCLRWLPDGGQRQPTRDEWIRDDWEIKEDGIPITRTQFWLAVREALVEVGADRTRLHGVVDELSDRSLGVLGRILGFSHD